MAPEVLARKLAYLRQLLADLAPFEEATLAQVEAEHYKVERLIELLVMTATDILFHELAGLGISPDSYRDAFRRAAEQKLLPRDLSERLQKAAGMRNILVHLYERIDFSILHASIQPSLKDFRHFLSIFEDRLAPED